MSKAKLLVIDDELAIRRFLRASVNPSDYDLVEAEDGQSGIRMVATESPDLVLLDLGLPDMDGVDVARRVREWSQVPIIILSARGDEMNKVEALDAGANDYLTKPFGVAELFARVRAALRLSQATVGDSVVSLGPLKIDLAAHLVTKAGAEIHLTKTEFRLLALLARNLGKVMTHRRLLTEVWGPEYADELHYLRVYTQQIRLKIEDDPAQPKLLITETGVGYRLKEPS
ncbi:MAG: response regulator [Armatimonadetes bacterium]|nr:response regulator [Armatimonadota bacterium]